MLNVRTGGRKVKATNGTYSYINIPRKTRKLKKAYKEAAKILREMRTERIEEFLNGNTSKKY